MTIGHPGSAEDAIQWLRTQEGPGGASVSPAEPMVAPPQPAATTGRPLIRRMLQMWAGVLTD